MAAGTPGALLEVRDRELESFLLQSPCLARAGRWFLNSGIQEPSGGVSRYYESEVCRLRPVSTEITGYAASTFAWLFAVTGDEIYLERARVTARFLIRCAWNRDLRIFPFEPSSSLAYFFDCGIIVRGLLAVWHQTREEELLAVARAACHGTIAAFRGRDGYHAIVELPELRPVERAGPWSQGPGCYQLKSALAWFDVAEVTGDAALRESWEEMLGNALATHTDFLSDGGDAGTRYGTMDRLHAYTYFVEALSAVSCRPDCQRAYAAALATIGRNLEQIAPFFVRSDVYAQLLRARINGAGFVPPDRTAAVSEAEALAHFQMKSEDRRIDGGFAFGRRDGVLSPHINPVSTAFAAQALEMWRISQSGGRLPCRSLLI